ncbi:MAG: TlpA family protein disulfide reductase [Eubacterium sp.]|nr:TlpA family protein disulfide reductase [Eubacterium sp.]
MATLVLPGCFLDDLTSEDTNTNVTSEGTESTIKNRPNVDTGTGEIKVLAEGDVAPDFTVELVSGEKVKLSDYDDKIVLLNFWATWCGPCVGEMPAFERLKSDGNDDLQILCINNMEDKRTVDDFIKSEGYTFDVGYDETGSIDAYYPSNGIPYTLVINKGYISSIYVGARDADYQYQEYKNAIDRCD